MPEFVTLSCPSCGAKLQIGNDTESFACNYCGNEHIVKRVGGIVSLVPLIDQLKSVRTGVDKTASELAIKRLKDDIKEIQMPDTNEGCLSRLSFGLLVITIIAIMGIIGFSQIFGGKVFNLENAPTIVVVFIAVSITIRIWIQYKINKNKTSKLKPYYDAIAQKKKEIEYHEKIVKSE